MTDKNKDKHSIKLGILTLPRNPPKEEEVSKKTEPQKNPKK